MISRLTFLVLSIGLLACTKKPDAVLIIKQWHLPPKVNSTNIQSSKRLPHYKHQTDLYNIIMDGLAKQDYSALVSEGCEGKIDKSFAKAFNGWNYKKLFEAKEKPSYVDILTLVPLKVKVKSSSTNVICGDDEKLLKENMLAMSDLRGFVGFLVRLLQKPDDQKYLAQVKTALKELGHGDVTHPTKFIKDKVIESWDKVFKSIYKRNDKFVKAIESLGRNYPMVVIGGIHAEDLKKKLEAKGIPVKMATPADYPTADEELIGKLDGIIEQLQKSN